MELVGESYARFFDSPQGTIGVMADIYTSDDILELRDLIIYPVGVNKMSIV